MILFRAMRRFIVTPAAAAIATLLLSGTLYANEGFPPLSVATSEGGNASSGVASSPERARDRITSDYVRDYLVDSGRLVTAPTRWDGSAWITAAAVAGATTAVYFVDSDIRTFAQRNQSSLGDRTADLGNALGNPLYTLPPLGLFYLYGQVTDDSKARQTSLLAVESLALSSALTWTVKEVAQRPRPFTGEASSNWHGPSSDIADYSFPSGHATAAFSVASVIAGQYGSNPYVPPLAYGLASLTAFARVYDDKHWASDVVLGGAIGYFVGKGVVGYHRTEHVSHLRVMPSVSRTGIIMVAEYRF